MGWLRDDQPDHEGWVVAVVRDDGRWRELQYGDVEQEISYVQIGCECGWRSPRLVAPLDTRWSPCMVVFPSWSSIEPDELYDDAAADLWDHHIAVDVDPKTPRALVLAPPRRLLRRCGL